MQKLQLTENQFRQIITESVRKILMESFKSNMLRKFFQEHGGVNSQYKQFSLGDIDDSQIGYSQEFNSFNEAANQLHHIKKPVARQRSEADMKYLFQIFVANDGTAMLVGINRSTIDTGVYWDGEHEKKVNDRLWRNGWNFKTRDNRYTDDSDTYYYNSPAKDFGVHNSNDFQNKKSDNERAYSSNSENKESIKQKKLKQMRDYLERHHPQIFNKLKK